MYAIHKGETHVKLDKRTGRLIEYIEGSRRARFSGDEIKLFIDGRETALFSADAAQNGDTAQWVYAYGEFEVTLAYAISEIGALKRRVKIIPRADIRLDCAEFCITPFDTPREIVPYRALYCAPVCAFIRDGENSWLTGMENPCFDMDAREDRVSLLLNAGLTLKQGEECELEPQFFALYGQSGALITDHADNFAYLPSKDEGRDHLRWFNPCSHIPLYRSECMKMRAYVQEYLDAPKRPFMTILYMYWLPIKQMPDCDRDVEEYKRCLRAFAELGGEMVVFNPLTPYSLPESGGGALWELAPKGSHAARILEYARSLGLQYGFYMGVAAHGKCGNAAALNYRPEITACKKRFKDGTLSRENCFGCDDHMEWLLSAHMNTIDEYRLDYLSWDPGPGNGAHCYSGGHGHVPGRGAYKGFRNTQKFLRALRERYPRIYMMSFYGRKEYGPWGFKYFDQHESYWEQSPSGCASLHPDLHDDRVNAHGVRLQCAWNQRFRFLPPAMNHVLVHRINERFFSPELTKVWDADGWRFALISAIALSGAITLDLLPRDERVIAEMQPFYRHWLKWAKDNIDTVNLSVHIGGCAETGRYDGVARIAGGRGHIFLFNSGPIKLKCRLRLDEEIGFTNDKCSIHTLYPSEGAQLYNCARGGGEFYNGDELIYDLEPYAALALELGPARSSLLYGLPGGGDIGADGALEWRSPAMEAGVYYPIALAPGVARLKLNGKLIGPCKGVVAGGAGVINRSLTRFTRDDGSAYPLFQNEAEREITLHARFRLERGLSTHVQKRAALDDPETLAQTARWRNKLDGGDYHNFLWAEKGRALIALFTRTCVGAGGMRARLDGRELSTEAFLLENKPVFLYARLPVSALTEGWHELRLEITDLKPKQFIGAWLEFAPYDLSADFAAAGDSDAAIELPERAETNTRASVQIKSAALSRDIVCASGDWIGVKAVVDGDAGQIDALYAENPTLPMVTRLTREAQSAVFSAMIPIGNREGNIIDNEEVRVYGIDINGARTNIARIPFTFTAAKPTPG